MSLPVHLVSSLTGVRAGSRVVVDGAEARHAVVVRRLRVGEQIALTDGRGAFAVGAVTETAKDSVAVDVASLRTVPFPSPELWWCRRSRRGTAESWRSSC